MTETMEAKKGDPSDTKVISGVPVSYLDFYNVMPLVYRNPFLKMKPLLGTEAKSVALCIIDTDIDISLQDVCPHLKKPGS